jgi:hypothetical protein
MPAKPEQQDEPFDAKRFVEETQLAPETQARIDRAWNDYVASQPAEQDTTREPGPRITRL